MGWIVTAALIVVAAGLGFWLTADTQRLSDEASEKRSEVRFAQRRVESLGEGIDALTEAQDQVRRAAGECLVTAEDALDYQELAARAIQLLRGQNLDEADATLVRAERFRKDANRSLRQCREAAAT